MPKLGKPPVEIGEDFVDAYSRKVGNRTNSNVKSNGGRVKTRRKFPKKGNVQKIEKGEDVWAQIVQQLSR